MSAKSAMWSRMVPALAEAGREPPQWLGKRFDAEGRPLKDSGCTIIGHVRDPQVRAALSGPRRALAAEGLDRFWAWLPESSYHMTMLDLVLHGRRAPELWAEGLPADLPEAEVDAAMLHRMRGAPAAPRPPFRMAPQSVYRGQGGVGVKLTGADAAEEARMRGLRDLLGAHAGVAHRPGHGTYTFHVTLAYLIAWPDAAEAERIDAIFDAAEAALLAAAPVIELGAPEVCTFHDMVEFRPQFTLG